MGELGDLPSMTSTELNATGEAVFGAKWVKPLSRAIGRNHRTVRYWKKGERRIPDDAAAVIRELGHIGPVGVIIRAAIKKVVPNVAPLSAHKAARQALRDLVSAGLLDADAA